MVRGVVVDEDLGAIAGATVSIDDYPKVAGDRPEWYFVLPAHAGKGQMIEIHGKRAS